MVDFNTSPPPPTLPPEGLDPAVEAVVLHVARLVRRHILTSREATPILALIATLAGERNGLRKIILRQEAAMVREQNRTR